MVLAAALQLTIQSSKFAKIGVIDPRGVVREHIGMGKRARIEGNVPPAAAPTLFSILGNWLALVWALALLGGSLAVKRRRAV